MQSVHALSIEEKKTCSLPTMNNKKVITQRRGGKKCLRDLNENALMKKKVQLSLTVPRSNTRLFWVHFMSVSGTEPSTSHDKVIWLSVTNCFGLWTILVDIGFTIYMEEGERENSLHSFQIYVIRYGSGSLLWWWCEWSKKRRVKYVGWKDIHKR